MALHNLWIKSDISARPRSGDHTNVIKRDAGSLNNLNRERKLLLLITRIYRFVLRDKFMIMNALKLFASGLFPSHPPVACSNIRSLSLRRILCCINTRSSETYNRQASSCMVFPSFPEALVCLLSQLGVLNFSLSP